MNLYLFDMDGTILNVDHIHEQAYERMYKDVYNIKHNLMLPPNEERTTHNILRCALKDRMPGEKIEEQMEDAIDHMVRLYHSRVNPLFVHSNIPHVLGKLNEEGMVAMFTGGARKVTNVILKKSNLHHHFNHISTCDDAPTRAEIVKHAIEKASLGRKFDKIFVIGDTPEDIKAAKKNKAISVAVPMSHYSKEQLLNHNPDIVIEDWKDTDHIMEQLK